MLSNNFIRTIFTVKEKRKDQLNKYKFFSALVTEAMGYEQLFWIVNYINERRFERQELLAPAQQSRLWAKGKKIMSPRGEQRTGVVIASVPEECEGSDYGKK